MSLHTTIIESNKKFVIHRMFDTDSNIRIPVSSGQTLSPVQIVAQAHQETGYEIVTAAKQLGIGPSDLKSHLKAQVGDQVKLGSLLAEKRRAFGRSIHVSSEVAGTIVDIINGNIFIARTPEDVNLRALVSGQVTQVLQNKGVAIEVEGARIQAVWSNDIEGSGQLMIQTESPTSKINMAALDADLFNAIVVVGHIESPNTLHRLAESGAKGVIAGTISAELFQSAAGWNLPLVLTDGAGFGGMYPPMFQMLSENSGKETALFNGKYSLSGRAEIVIAQDAPAETITSSPHKNFSRTELALGQTVRLITGENRGKSGTIQKIYNWPQITINGVRSKGADVEFENGEQFFVPTPNLDIIM